MDKEEKQRWVVAAIITVVVVAGLVFSIVLLSQPRVFKLALQPFSLTVREDMTGDAFGDLFGVGVMLLICLGGLLGGALLVADAESRTKAIGLWIGSLLGFWMMSVAARDKMTLSELRFDGASRSVSCAGFLVGRRMWGNMSIYSDIISVEFPMYGQYFGVLVKSKTSEFCSLHNKTVSRDDAKKMADALTKELGTTVVKRPPGL